jgi:hypothetical protein
MMFFSIGRSLAPAIGSATGLNQIGAEPREALSIQEREKPQTLIGPFCA